MELKDNFIQAIIVVAIIITIGMIVIAAFIEIIIITIMVVTFVETLIHFGWIHMLTYTIVTAIKHGITIIKVKIAIIIDTAFIVNAITIIINAMDSEIMDTFAGVYYFVIKINIIAVMMALASFIIRIDVVVIIVDVPKCCYWSYFKL